MLSKLCVNSMDYKGKLVEYYMRPGTSDKFVMEEQDYECIKLNKDDIWLDIGANIGAFPIKYAKHVGHMLCFEPNRENYGVLLHNLEYHRLLNEANVYSYNSAVVATGTAFQPLYVNKGENKGKHSLQPGIANVRPTYRELVHCIHYSTLMDADGVKVDIEGGEYELLSHMAIVGKLSNTKQLVFEYHYNPEYTTQTQEQFLRLEHTLRNYGKFSHIEIVAEDTKYKTYIVYCHA